MNGSGRRSWSCTYVAEHGVADATIARPAARYTARSARSPLAGSYGCSIHDRGEDAADDEEQRADREHARPERGRCRVRTCVGVSTRLTARQPRCRALPSIVPAHGCDADSITDEGVARLRARIGIPEPHPHAAALHAADRSTRSATSRSRTATTTRCGATPSTAPKTRWERPIASPVLVGGDTLIGEDEVHRGRARARAS